MLAVILADVLAAGALVDVALIVVLVAGAVVDGPVATVATAANTARPVWQFGQRINPVSANEIVSKLQVSEKTARTTKSRFFRFGGWCFYGCIAGGCGRSRSIGSSRDGLRLTRGGNSVLAEECD